MNVAAHCAGHGGSSTAPGGGGPVTGGLGSAGGTGLDAYAYGLLDPKAGAAGENLRLLGAATLGIEVTVPELARRCGLGNIDPQHGGGAGIGAPEGAAAIEACLTVTPPPAGTTLVTVRPDLDAFGAMALLALRHAGDTPSPAMQERIDRTARADRFDHGPWPGPRPLPSRCDEFASVTDQDPALVAVTGAMFDRELTVRDRVGLAARWLEAGVEPAGYRERWDGSRPGADWRVGERRGRRRAERRWPHCAGDLPAAGEPAARLLPGAGGRRSRSRVPRCRPARAAARGRGAVRARACRAPRGAGRAGVARAGVGWFEHHPRVAAGAAVRLGGGDDLGGSGSASWGWGYRYRVGWGEAVNRRVSRRQAPDEVRKGVSAPGRQLLVSAKPHAGRCLWSIRRDSACISFGPIGFARGLAAHRRSEP